MIIEPGDPRDPQVTALLADSHALLQDLFPPEDNYFLDIDELCQPNIRFLVAKVEGQVAGTGALSLQSGYAEVKSMYVDPAKRGNGIAEALLIALGDAARDEGVTCLRLETSDVLPAAVQLYTKHGFAPCALFGDYKPNNTSLFMEKTV